MNLSAKLKSWFKGKKWSEMSVEEMEKEIKDFDFVLAAYTILTLIVIVMVTIRGLGFWLVPMCFFIITINLMARNEMLSEMRFKKLEKRN